jgi:hypothetical protein
LRIGCLVVEWSGSRGFIIEQRVMEVVLFFIAVVEDNSLKKAHEDQYALEENPI